MNMRPQRRDAGGYLEHCEKASQAGKAMTSERHLYSGDAYLQLYPKLRKWIRVCARCGTRGYDPAMPDSTYPRGGCAVNHLHRCFRPLELDQMGRCEFCRDESCDRPGRPD
jgi:hypothetical protein